MQNFVKRNLFITILIIATYGGAATVAMAEAFIDDSKAKIVYKNYYWKEKDRGTSGYNRDSWVHALLGEYNSGKFKDKVGVDLGAASANEISVKHNGYSLTNLPTTSDGTPDNLTTVNYAYLRSEFKKSDFKFDLGVGKKQRHFSTFTDDGGRILPSGTIGIDTQLTFKGFKVYGTYFNKSSPRHQSYFGKILTNSAGAKIDYVYIIGLENKFDGGLELMFEHASSKDYLKKCFAKTAYSLQVNKTVSANFDLRFGQVKEDGNLYQTSGLKSSFYNINASLKGEKAELSFGFNITKDGDYVSTLFANDHGLFNTTLSQWEDYSLQDEKAYVLGGKYDFVDYLPGLVINVSYVNGSDAKDITNFKQKEYSVYTQYKFSGIADGLKLAWLYDEYHGKGENFGSRGGRLYKETSHRFYLTYAYNLL